MGVDHHGLMVGAVGEGECVGTGKYPVVVGGLSLLAVVYVHISLC